METINHILFSFLFLFVLSSCGGKADKKKDTVQTNAIPENTIPFEYDEKQLRAIIIKGTLNDTLPINIFFDTGLNDSRIIVPDILKKSLEIDSYLVQMNSELSRVQKVFFLDSDNVFFQFFGQNTVCIGFDFFEDKIIRISYRQKYIQKLDNTEGLEGYMCLPFKIEDNCERCLGVEIEAFVQGKHIKEVVLLDTGSNGFVTFNNNIIEKYSINVDDVQRVQTLNISRRKYSLHADSIKVGYAISNNQMTVEFSAENREKYPHSGILGNAFLENFEVILDFKNYKMYLKPNTSMMQE